MNLTQFLIFEICEECHRGHEHTWCPNRHAARWAHSCGRRPVTDEQIVAIVRDAYGRHGFRGLVGWHYYNEPLCAWWRLRPLLARLQREVPASRRCSGPTATSYLRNWLSCGPSRRSTSPTTPGAASPR